MANTNPLITRDANGRFKRVTPAMVAPRATANHRAELFAAQRERLDNRAGIIPADRRRGARANGYRGVMTRAELARRALEAERQASE